MYGEACVGAAGAAGCAGTAGVIGRPGAWGMARTGLGAASCGAAKRGCAASCDSRVMLDSTEGAAVTDPKLVYPPVPRERALLYGLTGAEASAYSSRGANVKHSREQREAIQEPRSPPRNTDTKGTGRTIADSVVTRTYPKERPREGDIMEDPALTSTTPVRVQPIERPRIAIVGKPNVGKSSLINKILGEKRLIVSDIAGTTRDAVDTVVKWNGSEYVFIDTAGLRRKSKIKEELERYSIIRTVSAVDRADVVVLLIDAIEGVTEQDAKIAGIAHDRGKGIVIAVNKWDAIEKDDKTIYKYTQDVRQTLSYMPYAEILFISAETGQRVPKLFETIDMVIQNQSMRVATGVLNEIMAEAVALQQPPSDKGKRLRLYYITQVAVKPPTFVIFVNDKELMHFSYTRYLENKIRDTFGFKGTSLKFIIRERKEKDAK